MQALRKAFDASLVDVVPGKREVVACISTGSKDRDNEVVQPDGLVRKHYAGLTVFYDHDTRLPIGVTQWVKSDANRVLAKYRISDKTEFSRDMFAMAQDGVLTGYSIGFLSREDSPPSTAEIAASPALAGVRRIYRKWELLEFSLVGIPSNPEATMLAISKKVSADTLARLQWKAGAAAPPLQPPLPADSQSAVPAGEPALNAAAAATSILQSRKLTTGEIAQLLAQRISWPDSSAYIEQAFARRAGRVD
ncbi:MAG: HK97 family phage prohead protease [Phycisphaerae bacterium]